MNLEVGTEVEELSSTLSPQEEQWQLAERIACSRCFSRSQFLSRFLLYVCGRKLQNRVHEISEQQIGVAVFGRPFGYDCGQDNIVRNYARTLRRRLEEYFETEGHDEVWHISIPRGGYTPVFTLRESKELEPPVTELLSPEGSTEETWNTTADPEEELPETSNIQSIFPWRFFQQKYFWTGAIVASLLLISLGFGYTTYQQQRRESVAHSLWTRIFADDRNTFLVPADSGVGILQNLTHQAVHIDRYETGNYFTQQSANERSLDDLRTQRYTSISDLNIVLSLTRLPEFKADHSVIRFARDLTIDDIKSSNIVLLGSSHSNPWAEIFEKELNFHFVYGSQVDDSFIKNEHPQNGEQPIYVNEWDLPTHRTYAVIALRPNLGGNGWVLLIEGLNMAGTQAGADILLTAPAISDFLKQATIANKLHPFELLIETTSLGSEPGRSRVLAKRIE